jgi:UDP-glucose 4-epimerase
MDSTPTGRTVLVTGGAGFVGSHLADALVADNEVRVLDALSTGRRSNVPEGATLIEGDLRGDTLAEAAADVDLIFHQAGLVSVPRSVEAPAESNAVNAGGTVRVLEAARRAGARVVLASSCAIYGHPDSVPVPEAAPKRPASPYAVDKLALDHYGRLYHDLHGLDTVVLRYFNVYGPRQRGGDYAGVVAAFREQARDGGPLTVHGDGTQTRDFVHVEDVVRANLLAATTEHVGEAFNVGTGRSVSIRELAETVRRVADADPEIVHTEDRAGDVDRSEADVSKARALLDYEPTVLLVEGLAELV